MASWSYIDAYISSIPAAQKQNLLNLIYGNVINNEIQTLDQYQSALNIELAQISAGLPTPVFTQYNAPFQSVTNSANYNSMEAQAISALGILYQEANLLDQAIVNYGNVVTGNLSSIEATIANLEKQVDTLELLASNTDGYVTSVYDSFNEANTYRLNRIDTISTSPFTLPTLGFISSVYDAQIVNNMLQLPVSSTNTYNIIGASLENQTPVSGPSVTNSSDLPANINTYDVSNLSSGNGYWVETCDQTSLVQNSSEADLILEIGGAQQMNNIVINPFTRFTFNITSIQYTKNIASGQYFEMIDDPSTTYPIQVNGQTTIEFSPKYADSVKIHIQQQNYSTLRYIEQGSNNTITEIFDVTTGTEIPTTTITDPNNYYFAMTNIMQNLLSIDQTKLTDTNTISVYEFLYGIKTISFNQTQYLKEGIYVSQPYTIPNAGAIGLDTVDTIPNNQSDYNYTSIEYDVLVEYDNIVGSGTPQFVSSFVQNILPANVINIVGEVLDGIYDPGTGLWIASTRFGVSNLSGMVVYQNGILLNPSFYTTYQDPTTNIVTVSINNSQISQAQLNVSFYTISYIPIQAAYIVNLEQHSQAIINLRMFLRSSSPNTMLTPSVDSYSMKFKEYVSH